MVFGLHFFLVIWIAVGIIRESRIGVAVVEGNPPISDPRQSDRRRR